MLNPREVLEWIALFFAFVGALGFVTVKLLLNIARRNETEELKRQKEREVTTSRHFESSTTPVGTR